MSSLTNVCFRSTFKWRLLLRGNQAIQLHCISICWLLHSRSFHLKVFLNGHSHCFCLHTPETPIWMTCSWLHRTSVVCLVLLYYNLFEHIINFSRFTITFSDLSYVSGLDILSSYFISFIVWIAVLDKSVLMSLW